jgi:beta-lactamase superfamily II metal-dependent hydrolase
MQASNRHAFVGYPAAVLYRQPGKKGPVQQLLWGDWLRILKKRRDGWWFVHCRGCDGWIKEELVQPHRLLELVFVDVGQGDGCLIVTPNDEHLLVDCGAGGNMHRFLRWRYGGFRARRSFQAVVLTHPDEDHYGGLGRLLNEPSLHFDCVYHNGIIERHPRQSLGQRVTVDGKTYLSSVVRSEDDLKAFLADKRRWNRKRFAALLQEVMESDRVGGCRMLCQLDRYLPGYSAENDLSIEVLGPWLEPAGLRWLGRIGSSKNGHSIVLRLRYGGIRILLGGDLNADAENLLLSHYTGMDSMPKSVEGRRRLIEAARPIFEADVAKACHHGSTDFSELFLRATNPIATVVSSGDNERHSHPQADALGAIGRYGRGLRPLIFSTELARSAKNAIKHPHVLKWKLDKAYRDMQAAKTAAARKRAARRRDRLLEKIGRSIAVFGAINLRSDGRRVILAQKREQPRAKGQKWDIYKLEPDAQGDLQYVPRR